MFINQKGALMYNIDFYETADGFSDVKELLDSLRTKSTSTMEHMSYCTIIKKISENTPQRNPQSQIRDERLHLKKGAHQMNWNEYKEQVKLTDPVGKEILEEAEAEASIISAIIRRRAELGLSQRDLANLCDIPQSSIARIESSKTTPRLDTLLKLFRQLGLTFKISPIAFTK